MADITRVKLESLRSRLAESKVDGFLVPVADEYQGEYPPASARRATWLTGFTGSAGLVAVTAKKAAMFVDGRYTVQVRNQVDGTLYDYQDFTSVDMRDWLTANLKEGQVLGYDSWLHTQAGLEALRNVLLEKGVRMVALKQNPLDAVWHDRPAAPQSPVVIYPEVLAGESSANKRKKLAEHLQTRKLDAAIITAPDAICWLLNVRGGDTPHTPQALSFAILYASGKLEWFIDAAKLSKEVLAHVGKEVTALPQEDMPKHIKALAEKRVLLDTRRSAAWFYDVLEEAHAKIITGDDICLLPKACKNKAEIDAIRAAHVRDGVAIVNFLHWLDTNVTNGKITELQAETQLLAFRNEQPGFQEPSFDTIAGFGAHGAIVHYRATDESNKTLKGNGLFLLDSGGQYCDEKAGVAATTDITRTMVIGEPTSEQKRRFTQVLQGHIGLASAIFPAGTAGKHLDVLARKALWEDGVDYAHGTGHGVGAYLGVHEGPQGISLRNDVPLQEGMLISNEPGFYKEGEFGIRIESLVFVVKQPNGYLGFETVTMAPIDRRLIEESMLTDQEKSWLNDYHIKMYKTLSPLLNGEKKLWLEKVTEML